MLCAVVEIMDSPFKCFDCFDSTLRCGLVDMCASNVQCV